MFAYTRTDNGINKNYYRTIVYENSAISLGEEHLIDSREGTDPVIFPNNHWIAYYRKGEAHSGQMMIYDTKTGEYFVWGEANGCTHATVSYDGLTLLCQVDNTFYMRSYDADVGAWSSFRSVVPSLSEDYDFASSCDLYGFGHPEFCGDTSHLLVTVDCMRNGQHAAAKLVLMNLDGSLDTDLSGQIDSFLGSENSDSFTGVCSQVS